MNEDQIVAELTANPDLQTKLFDKLEPNFTKYLTDSKSKVVTTVDEYKTTTQAAIDKAIKDGHTAWEQKLEKLTGQKRPEGKKGLEWFDEITPNLKYGQHDESAFVKGLQKELTDLKTSLATEKEQTLKAEANGKVSSAISGLKFAVPGHLKKEDEISAYQRSKAAQMVLVFNSLYKAEKKEDGTWQYVNAKGEAQVENGEPMTADQIAARDFVNDLAPKGKSQGGTGSVNSDPNSTNDGYLGADAKAIEAKLAEMGKVYMSPEWEELYRKALKAIGKGL